MIEALRVSSCQELIPDGFDESISSFHFSQKVNVCLICIMLRFGAGFKDYSKKCLNRNDEIENVSTGRRFLKTQIEIFGGGSKSVDQEISEKTSDMFTLWFERIFLQTQKTHAKSEMCARENGKLKKLVFRKCRNVSTAACNVSTAQTQNVSTAPLQPDVDFVEALRLELGALEVKRTGAALLPDQSRHPVEVLQKVVEVVVVVDGPNPGPRPQSRACGRGYQSTP